MKPANWGPNLWRSIHYVALGYPEFPTYEEKENYKQFYINLQYIIPCKFCRIHYAENLTELPMIDLYLDTQIRLFEWTVMLHNKVNRMLNKKEYTLKEAYDLYKLNTNEYIYYIIACIIVIILMIYFLFYK